MAIQFLGLGISPLILFVDAIVEAVGDRLIKLQARVEDDNGTCHDIAIATRIRNWKHGELASMEEVVSYDANDTQ